MTENANKTTYKNRHADEERAVRLEIVDGRCYCRRELNDVALVLNARENLGTLFRNCVVML